MVSVRIQAIRQGMGSFHSNKDPYTLSEPSPSFPYCVLGLLRPAMRGAADPDGRVVFAILSLSVLGLTEATPWARKVIFAPIAALSIYLVFFTASDSLPNDYFQGCATMINLFRMSDLLLLTDVQKEIRKKGETRNISTLPFFTRLWWALSLYVSLRGVGWDHEPTSHLPTPPKTSKLRFVLRQTVALAQSYLLFNFGNLLVLLNSSFSEGGPPFTSQKWWLRPTVIGQTLQVKGFLQGLYVICSIIGVVANLSTPYDWPPLFGSFTGAYTVRNYWGYVQTCHSSFPNCPSNMIFVV